MEMWFVCNYYEFCRCQIGHAWERVNVPLAFVIRMHPHHVAQKCLRTHLSTYFSFSLSLQQGSGPTPKQRLLSWLNNKLADRPVKNFTTDWNDGTAIGALVDACAPGLCPDWRKWEPKQNLRNATEAMNAAEQWLEVPQLIRPEEMINPRVDEKAMMTYLSQFPSAKLKDGAPLRPKSAPELVKAYGPGL